MVEHKIQVSNSELDVLKFIWRYEPVTCGLITHGMQERNSWHPSTTKTLIRRLLDKNVITFNTSKNQRLDRLQLTRQKN
ncbi:CopY/TcrY family copper transport repressor [Enterococcus faecium]|nr:CopY/TcrY family copper transport repressor [Enterococcus faecium]